jgi:hypothetical protein
MLGNRNKTKPKRTLSRLSDKRKTEDLDKLNNNKTINPSNKNTG